MTEPQRACFCATCQDAVLKHDHPDNLMARITGRRFIVCNQCGDKRCPRAQQHDNRCAYW